MTISDTWICGSYCKKNNVDIYLSQIVENIAGMIHTEIDS